MYTQVGTLPLPTYLFTSYHNNDHNNITEHSPPKKKRDCIPLLLFTPIYLLHYFIVHYINSTERNKNLRLQSIEKEFYPVLSK